MKVLVLLSGGVDSCVLLGKALADGHDVEAISFLYGAKHERAETSASRAIAEHYNVKRHVADLRDGFADIRKASSLTGGTGSAYVPGRNSILIAVAVGVAESLGCYEVLHGATADDHRDFPDCRPEYFQAMSEVAQIGTQSGVRVSAPFVDMLKASVIRLGLETLDAPLHLTHTCYEGSSPACGECLACRTRQKAFHRALKIDPANYRAASA